MAVRFSGCSTRGVESLLDSFLATHGCATSKKKEAMECVDANRWNLNFSSSDSKKPVWNASNLTTSDPLPAYRPNCLKSLECLQLAWHIHGLDATLACIPNPCVHSHQPKRDCHRRTRLSGEDCLRLGAEGWGVTAFSGSSSKMSSSSDSSNCRRPRSMSRDSGDNGSSQVCSSSECNGFCTWVWSTITISTELPIHPPLTAPGSGCDSRFFFWSMCGELTANFGWMAILGFQVYGFIWRMKLCLETLRHQARMLYLSMKIKSAHDRYGAQVWMKQSQAVNRKNEHKTKSWSHACYHVHGILITRHVKIPATLDATRYNMTAHLFEDLLMLNLNPGHKRR